MLTPRSWQRRAEGCPGSANLPCPQEAAGGAPHSCWEWPGKHAQLSTLQTRTAAGDTMPIKLKEPRSERRPVWVWNVPRPRELSSFLSKTTVSELQKTQCFINIQSLKPEVLKAILAIYFPLTELCSVHSASEAPLK